MPNIAAVLKNEIARVAKKELRDEVTSLRRAVSAHRSEIAALKRLIQEQQRAIRSLQKAKPKAAEVDDGEPAKQLRFSASRLAAQRKKLGLSAAEFGHLVGTTAQSIYNWESGKARPGADRLTALAALRGIGKRELAARLAQLGDSASAQQ
jgi:DNA-binding transcriptional regulator YiaG